MYDKGSEVLCRRGALAPLKCFEPFSDFLLFARLPYRTKFQRTKFSSNEILSKIVDSDKSRVTRLDQLTRSAKPLLP